MRAVTFTRVGDPVGVLEINEIPVPAPKPGEVRIRVGSSVIHPADFLFIRGVYRLKPRFPQAAGFDGVGTVETLGAGVDEHLLGRRVAFRAPGAWAEFVIAPLSRIHLVPDGISDEVACQFALNPFTAWGLLQEASVPSGGRLLLTAGRSNVACLAARLAERRGIRVLLIARSAAGYDVVDLHGVGNARPSTSLSEALISVGEDKGFDAIFDPVGGPGTLALIDVAAVGGVLITYGVLGDRPFEMNASAIVYKNLTWRGFGYDRFMSSLDEDSLVRPREELWDLLKVDPDAVPIRAAYALEQVEHAVRASAAGGARGKILLRID